MSSSVSKYVLALLMCLPAAGFAKDYLCTYQARISNADKYNSAGEPLKKSGSDVATVAAILRQDRANFHVFNKRDSEDQTDCVFDEKKNREIFESFVRNGSISNDASYAIINGNPLINVEIYPEYVKVKIVDEPVRKKSTVQ
ncbi:hypothetical protein [Uliginosibacterium gangwonense]|uniref:hypothetical protein n=1 Tax=Uliginosibacterium gangwonense TaxID=392736 RepID=UPI0003759A83|nr:hypothetical protein [Uliginosibacterium gangwonense]